jgi:hypothetical protein
MTLPLDAPLSAHAGRWIEIACACGHVTAYPARLLLAESPHATIRDAIAELVCHGCGAAEPEIVLTNGAVVAAAAGVINRSSALVVDAKMAGRWGSSWVR